MAKRGKREPYMLPDNQCTRLIRPEMDAVRMLLAALSAAAYAKEDLQGRGKTGAARASQAPDGAGRSEGCVRRHCRHDQPGTV